MSSQNESHEMNRFMPANFSLNHLECVQENSWGVDDESTSKKKKKVTKIVT